MAVTGMCIQTVFASHTIQVFAKLEKSQNTPLGTNEKNEPKGVRLKDVTTHILQKGIAASTIQESDNTETPILRKNMTGQRSRIINAQ